MNTLSHVNDRGLVNDKSIAALSGSSQTLLVANPDRRYLLIQNTGAADVGVNLLGGTAALAGPGTIILTPGGSYEPDANFIPTNAITVIGTVAEPVFCVEA